MKRSRGAMLIALHVLSLASAAYALLSTHVVHERRDASSTLWTRGARLPENLIVPVKIGLVQTNLDKGHDILMDISHPESKNYAQHLTADELDELFAPSVEHRSAVISWLKSEGIEHVTMTANKEWIHFDVRVKKAEALFHTKYYAFKNNMNGKIRAGCDSYHLPHHIHPLVDYIKPGVHPIGTVPGTTSEASGVHAKQGATTKRYSKLEEDVFFVRNLDNAKSDCSKRVTPHCYRERYNITDKLKPQQGNSMGIYESELDFLHENSLKDFFRAYTDIPINTFPDVVRIDGAPAVRSNKSQSHRGDEGESDLDFQVAYPLVYPDKMILYQVDDWYWEKKQLHSTLGEFNTFLDALDGSYCHREAFGIKGDSPKKDPVYPDHHKGPHPYEHKEQCGRFKPAPVISFSYGLDEENYPTNYARRQCTEWMKLALQGTTMVMASGDYGVHPQVRKHCEGPDHKAFGPTDVTTCPYVLGVGSTQLQSLTGKDAEIASRAFGSGGGFSNIYPRPAYQNESLNYYFKHYKPPYKSYSTKYQSKPTEKGRYNRVGRGFPDVSAIGEKIVTYFHGHLSPGYGTSASAPLWGALLTRINNARKIAGKKPVGFVNQVLYKHPELLNDITKGNNPGCKTPGFKAVPGWDPVTGLGTPNYGLLKDFFLGLP